jgi:hypothetical protein
VTAVNSDGSLNLVNGDFLENNGVGVQYNTDVSGPSWYAPGEEWAFVSPQLPSEQLQYCTDSYCLNAWNGGPYVQERPLGRMARTRKPK